MLCCWWRLYACICCAGRGGPLLDGESAQSISEADVVGLLEAVLRLPKLAAAAREVALTAAMKLTARLPSQVRGRGGLHYHVDSLFLVCSAQQRLRHARAFGDGVLAACFAKLLGC
jgi:hypothetical protein